MSKNATRPVADLDFVYERSGDGIVFARSKEFEFVAFREPWRDEFSHLVAATRIVARLRNPNHEFVTIDGFRLDGDVLQVSLPVVFGDLLPTPTLAQLWSVPLTWGWVQLDSHLLFGNNDWSMRSPDGFSFDEENDESDPFELSDALRAGEHDGAPIVGIGSISHASHASIFVPSRFEHRNELNLALAVMPLEGEEVTLTVGLQGVDENSTPLPELGFIESISIPFFGERMCDLDFDGDCDVEDLPNGFVTFTDEAVTQWLDIVGTVFGDADMDGDVDVIDLNQVGINWQRQVNHSWSSGDFDRDGDVDAHDLNYVGVNWQFGVAEGSNTPNPIGVPEPGGLMLAAMGFCLLASARALLTVSAECPAISSGTSKAIRTIWPN